MYNHVHAFTNDLTIFKAYARTTSRMNDISKVVVTMNLPKPPLVAHWLGTYLKVLPCQR